MIDPPRRIAAAVTGAGVALCVLGWYQIAGQPTVPQQLPYLASATIPGAALLCAGLVLLLRAPAGDGGGRGERRATNAAEAEAAISTEKFWRVPDGRYLHTADCPLLDGRTDQTPVVTDSGTTDPAFDGPEVAGPAVAGPAFDTPSVRLLRPCPLCQAGTNTNTNTSTNTHAAPVPNPTPVPNPVPRPARASTPAPASRPNPGRHPRPHPSDSSVHPSPHPDSEPDPDPDPDR
jgi:hypothetical protein